MMHKRCEDPKHVSYKHYGGRGIKVCERWNTFENFLADVGPRPSKNHSLDRSDSNGDYTPLGPDGAPQVTWKTSKYQGRHKRKSLFLPHPTTGVMIPAAEVAEILGVSYQIMRARYIKEGKWPT